MKGCSADKPFVALIAVGTRPKGSEAGVYDSNGTQCNGLPPTYLPLVGSSKIVCRMIYSRMIKKRILSTESLSTESF